MVVVHAAYVGFVVLGLLAILLGVLFRWRWVRNFWFRAAHLLAISLVVVQVLAGIVCPLTTLENYLRRLAGQGVYPDSFIGFWAHELLFYEAPPWVFQLSYCLFGAAVLAAFLLDPPRWPWEKRPT